MKKITAIVRPEKLESLKDALFAAKVSGMTISQVQGCGNQHGWKEYYRGTEVMLNMIPKVKFELIVDDEQVESLVELIRSTARTGEVGDGKIFIFPVEEVVRMLYEKGFAGADVDFEYVPPAAAAQYPLFLEKLHRRLEPLGFLLFSALVPKTSDDQPGAFYEGHLYREIAAASDFVLLMTYE